MAGERVPIQAVKKRKYPNIDSLIERKRQHRRHLAALPFEQKMELVFKLRERQKFIKSGRKVNPPSKTK